MDMNKFPISGMMVHTNMNLGGILERQVRRLLKEILGLFKEQNLEVAGICHILSF